MTDMHQKIFVVSGNRLPLLNDKGRDFLGLKGSSSPEIGERVVSLFESLNEKIGFADSQKGREAQECFNILLRAIYPEIMIDLADIIYVQHERPAVFLNFDHINLNLRRDSKENPEELIRKNREMESLFKEFARFIGEDPGLYNDPLVVRFLSESYSYYLFQTHNFPWEDPIRIDPPIQGLPVLDVASGLAGFSMIHHWPASHPSLILTDNMPFIIQGLTHFKKLAAKKNVEILNIDFPDRAPAGMNLSLIMSNKFLHHLKRMERKQFLQWALDNLVPNGILGVLDTDIEHQILMKARDPVFRNRLTTGYPETLVEIERDFCETLVGDIKKSGFKVTHFDFHEYMDETDAYSQQPGDNLSLKFMGFEIMAEKLPH